jgi:hypothetical protein
MTKVFDQVVQKISKQSIGNDRVAFNRRLGNLEQFVREEINPLEEQILLLREQLIPLYDKLQQLRDEACEHCLHPPEMLSIGVAVDNFAPVECKFCGQKFHIEVDEQDERTDTV